MASAAYINDPENPVGLLQYTSSCNQIVDSDNNRIEQECNNGAKSYLQKVSEKINFDNVVMYGSDPEYGEFDTNYEFCSHQSKSSSSFFYSFQSQYQLALFSEVVSIEVSEPLQTGTYTYGDPDLPYNFKLVDFQKAILCCSSVKEGSMVVDRDPQTNMITLHIDLLVRYMNDEAPFTATIQFTDYLIR